MVLFSAINKAPASFDRIGIKRERISPAFRNRAQSINEIKEEISSMEEIFNLQKMYDIKKQEEIIEKNLKKMGYIN